MPLLLFYREKIAYFTDRLRLLQKRINLFAFLRLIGFLGFCCCAYFFVQSSAPFLLLGAGLCIVAFLLSVNIYFRTKRLKLFYEKLLFVNSNEKSILEHQPNKFDNGQQFVSPGGYLDDLDIFGQHSVFHLLNRTTTAHGRRKLAELLTHPLQQAAEICIYQDALRELTAQTDKRQELTASGLLHEEKEVLLEDLSAWVWRPGRLDKKKWLLAGRWILVLFNLAGLLFYLSSDNYLPLLGGILISWVITGYFSKYIAGQHALVSKKHEVLQQYATILERASQFNPGASVYLQQLQEQTKTAYQAIRKLGKLSSLFDQRLNYMVYVLLNSFLLYDIHCMISLEKWKEKNRQSFSSWMEAVGVIECLNSLAGFAFNNPGNCYPVPVERAGLFVDASQMAHPLLKEGERIPNDFAMGETSKLILVTGSNMSGKTTFLRTIGVNVLLAQCGAPVCARTFSFTPMDIVSSLRVSDSLQEHTSYFMAELKKLQEIILHLQTGRPTLVLIDEILRGTNSEDKTHGSDQYIRKLIQYHCLTLFATHDLALSTLETAYRGVICNFCFESSIQTGELRFDYKLHAGVAKNKNASFLMQKMGII